MRGSKTMYYSGTISNEAKKLQMPLISTGSILRIGGKADERTSTKYFKFSNTYLLI